MRTHFTRFFFFLFFCSATFLSAWSPNDRTVALVDLSSRVRGIDSKLFSLRHALIVSGLPFFETEDPVHALNCKMIVFSDRLEGGELDPSERIQLENYVNAGGILVVPRMTALHWYDFFGLEAEESHVDHRTLTWLVGEGFPGLGWFDDPNEITVSLSAPDSGDSFFTKALTPSDSQVFARFDDGTAAATIRQVGAGYTINLGFSWRDIILRNQLNRDNGAQRTFSNGFEPTSDTFMLFLRGLYEDLVPNATYKHTSPYQSLSTVMLTHDADSTSSMVTMAEFGHLERNNGIDATYLVTTHYIADDIAGNFYFGYEDEIQELLDMDHNVASHSVGHFPDFWSSSIFPIGVPGLDEFSYQPAHEDGLTHNGTIYGELDVSKYLLERDTTAQVRSYRSGFLAFNPSQINVLEDLGYDYDTTRSANDVLTNFPYQQHRDNNYSGDLSHVIEIPMCISDVWNDISAETMDAIVDVWLDVIRRNQANNAPTVLLIHPNRSFKVDGQERVIAETDPNTLFMSLEGYGDFWRAREAFTYRETLANNRLTIVLDGPNPNPMMSIVVRNGRDLDKIEVTADGAGVLPALQSEWGENDILIHFDEYRRLQLTSPEAGSVLRPGRDLTLRWRSFGTVGSVSLEFSRDNGVTWEEITPNTPNDGLFEWRLPEADSEACRFRVREVGSGLSDMSDGRLTVSALVVTSELQNLVDLWLLPDGSHDLNGNGRVDVLDMVAAGPDIFRTPAQERATVVEPPDDTRCHHPATLGH